jgi:hypothetical protein
MDDKAENVVQQYTNAQKGDDFSHGQIAQAQLR